MKKIVGVLVLGIFFLSVVCAVEQEIIFRSEPYSFGGAVLWIKSPEVKEYGDKIYPSRHDQKDLGIVRFSFDTDLSEFDLKIRLSDGEEIVLMEELGPITASENELVIDLRGEPHVESPVIEETVMEVSQTSEIDTVAGEIVNETLENETSSDGFISKVTGFVSSGINEKTKPFYFGGLGVFMAMVLFFFIVRKAFKSGAKAELKNLGRMQLDEKLDALDN